MMLEDDLSDGKNPLEPLEPELPPQTEMFEICTGGKTRSEALQKADLLALVQYSEHDGLISLSRNMPQFKRVSANNVRVVVSYSVQVEEPQFLVQVDRTTREATKVELGSVELVVEASDWTDLRTEIVDQLESLREFTPKPEPPPEFDLPKVDEPVEPDPAVPGPIGKLEL